jgi:hypothetical protein
MGGGLQVAHSFIHELINYTEHFYVVLFSKQLGEILKPSEFSNNFIFIPCNVRFLGNRRSRILDNIVDEYRISSVFTVFGPSYWNPKVVHICGYAKPHYIYRNSPFIANLSIMAKLKLKIKEFVHLNSFKRSTALISENEDVSIKLKSLFPKQNIYTVTNYYNQIFENKNNWDYSCKLTDFDGITILTIASNYPHKNLRIIPSVIRCILSIDSQFKFRFVLSIKVNEIEIDDELKKYIIFLGKIDINQCPYLYQQSDLLFLPTLLECFSASYAEAMYMQKPILTSNLDFA